jgi:hypothetical protein
MEFRKLSPNGDATSVSLPKDELVDLEIVDDDGELRGDHWAHVEHVGDGEFRIEVMWAE